jgi:hypothetical protein
MLHIETKSATSRWRKSFSLLMHEVSCMRIKKKIMGAKNNRKKKIKGQRTGFKISSPKFVSSME